MLVLQSQEPLPLIGKPFGKAEILVHFRRSRDDYAGASYLEPRCVVRDVGYRGIGYERRISKEPRRRDHPSKLAGDALDAGQVPRGNWQESSTSLPRLGDLVRKSI